jgi:hypothetical protein
MDGALVGAGSLWPQCCFVFHGVEGTVAPRTGTYTVYVEAGPFYYISLFIQVL